MVEQLELLEVKQTYSLLHLKDMCFDETRKQYPKAVEGELQEEYLEFVRSEAMMLFAQRLRELADDIERKELEPIKKNIKIMYDK